MAQEPTMKFNSNSKGFSLGWDAPDVKSATSKSFYSAKTEPTETPSNRASRFLDKKPLETFSKVGASDPKLLAPEVTPKITRNDKERSTFYFGDLPPPEDRAFRKKQKTEKEVEQDRVKYEEAKKLKQRAKKEEIQKLHNSNICKIQESTKKRQSFRF